MKKLVNNLLNLVLSTLMFIFTMSIMAQSPEMFSYQAVVRDGSGNLVTNSNVGMQVSILQGSASGTEVYVETFTPTTNDNGLVTVEIGNGTVVSGDFTAIDWNDGPYFIKIETDPAGGTNYTVIGTSQLLSVPYAMHAKEINNVKTNTDMADVEIATDDNMALLYIRPVANNFNDSSGIYFGEGTHPDNYGIMMIYDGGDNTLEFRGKGADTIPIFKVYRSGYVSFSDGITIEKETSTPTPNNVYGNSLPMAYGYIKSYMTGPVISEDYGVASVTSTSNGIFEVTLDHSWASGSYPVVIATSYNGTNDTEVITYSFTTPNKIIFHVVDENNAPQDSNFSFVVFGRTQ